MKKILCLFMRKDIDNAKGQIELFNEQSMHHKKMSSNFALMLHIMCGSSKTGVKTCTCGSSSKVVISHNNNTFEYL